MGDLQHPARRSVVLWLASLLAPWSRALSAPADQAEPVATDFLARARNSAAPLSDGALLAAAGDAQVIALGEFMHGGHEPLDLRNRIIRLLAAQGKITAVAVESGLIEARRLNDYIMGGAGDAVSVARKYFTWGFGRFGENVALLDQLREHNARTGSDKISIYGVDIPGGNDRAIGDISIAVTDSMAYLRRLTFPESESIFTGLEPFAQDLTLKRWFKLSPDERHSLVQSVEALPRFLTAYRTACIGATSEDDYAWAQRTSEVLRQVIQMFRAWPTDNQLGNSPKGMWPPAQIRDAAMTENFMWALGRQGSSGRMLLFAATGHVERSLDSGTLPAGFPRALESMGYHLKSQLGERMTVMLTGARIAPPWMGRGNGKTESGTLAAKLAEVSDSAFVLDVRHAPSDPWLDEPQILGANLCLIRARAREACDSIAFFPNVVPAQNTRP